MLSLTIVNNAGRSSTRPFVHVLTTDTLPMILIHYLGDPVMKHTAPTTAIRVGLTTCAAVFATLITTSSTMAQMGPGSGGFTSPAWTYSTKLTGTKSYDTTLTYNGLHVVGEYQSFICMLTGPNGASNQTDGKVLDAIDTKNWPSFVLPDIGSGVAAAIQKSFDKGNGDCELYCTTFSGSLANCQGGTLMAP
jgi:hypothetical protein